MLLHSLKRIKLSPNIFSLSLFVAVIAVLLASFAVYRTHSRVKNLSIENKTSHSYHNLTLSAFKLYFDLENKIRSLAESEVLAQSLSEKDYGKIADDLYAFEKSFKKHYPFNLLTNIYLPDKREFFSIDANGNQKFLPPYSSVRKSIESRSEIRGYKVVNSELYYKVLKPVYHKEEFIGILESCIAVRDILTFFEDEHGIPFSLYFDRSDFPMLANMQPGKVINYGNLYLISFVKDELFHNSFQNGETPPAGEEKVSYNNKYFIVHNAGKITGTEGESFGGVLVAHDITGIISRYNRNMLASLSLIFAVGIILFIAVNYFITKNLKFSLNKFNKEKKYTAGGKTCPGIPGNKTDFKENAKEAKETKYNLIRDENHFKQFLDDLPLGVFIKDEGSRTVYLNKFMDEVFCKKNGKEKIFTGKTARLEREEDKKVLEGKNLVVEKILPDKNMNERIYMVHKFAMKGSQNGKNKVGGIYIDITKRKEAEYKLRILSRAIRYSPVCVVITDPEGKIEFVNPAFTNITGYSFSEVMGKNMNVLNSGKHPDEFFAKMWNRIKNGKDWQGEILNKKKSGELFCEKISISAIKNSKREITNFVAIKDDITSRKEAEKQIRQAKEKAEESDRLKTSFLANMSHEIRTPLNAIVGLSSLLVDTEISLQERKSFGNIINENSQVLLKLIDDIIDISKIEAGQIKISESKCNINQLLDEIVETFKAQIKTDKKKSLSLYLNKGLQNEKATIITDPHRLRQIVVNLVGNSCKFTEEGSIEFGYAVQMEGELQFYVRDTGIGIPKDKIDLIFNRFRQAQDESTRSHGGTGLGLTISKSLVELLGGKIWVESKPGQGTTFFFTIPHKPADTEVSGKQIVRLRKKHPLLKDKNILIAEDMEANFRLIEAFFKKTKANILWAKNGKEAIEICRRNKSVDILLLDINMPVVNGYDALLEIKKIKPSLPVIIQTAYAMAGEKERFIKAGCNDYLTKPIDPQELFDSIQKCI